MQQGSAVVVGGGIMGRDIAAIFLHAGWATQVVARSAGQWAGASAQMARSVQQMGGVFAAGRLQLRSSLAEVAWAGVDIVVETVSENLPLKQQVFAELDRLVPPGVPIGSNSSALRITHIAAACESRERMANAHFFLPAHLVPLVEVAKGESTSEATMDRLMQVFAAVGRVPVRVNRDVPGFLANRIQHALMREAFSVIDEGLASAEDVDAAVRYGFGFRYVAAGPILQKEFSGLDTQAAAAAAVYPSLCNAATPSRALSEKVAAGRLGTKTGHGFWDWTAEQVQAERARYEETLLQAARLLTPALIPGTAEVAP